jgi:hypothetical protein
MVSGYSGGVEWELQLDVVSMLVQQGVLREYRGMRYNAIPSPLHQGVLCQSSAMGATSMSRQKCTGIRKDGTPCTNWAIGDTGHCRHHQANHEAPGLELPSYAVQLCLRHGQQVQEIVDAIGPRKGSPDIITLIYMASDEESRAAGWGAQERTGREDRA